MGEMIQPNHLTTAIALAAACAALAGCQKKSTEAAPVKQGDVLEYLIATSDSKVSVKVKISALDAESFKIESEPPDGPPIIVDRGLSPGKEIKMHLLGCLWLPPSERKIGGRSINGTVKDERRQGTMDVWRVTSVEGNDYYFEKRSGLLAGYEIGMQAGQRRATLISTSVAGVL